MTSMSIQFPCQFYNCYNKQVGAFCDEHGISLGRIQEIINMMLSVPYNAKDDIKLLTLKSIVYSSCHKLTEALKQCQKKVSPKQMENITEAADISARIA